MSLNLTPLSGIIPDAVLEQITDDFQAQYNCNLPIRLAHFLAQCAHESGGFKVASENLYYNVGGLMTVFPRFFTAKDIANEYAMQPEKIANRVYANRMGNGDENSGDGYKYRGRGYIELTGKDNYTAFNDTVSGDDVVANPDLVATTYPLASAGFFFDSNGLWAVCDSGDTSVAVTAVTKRVNGGVNGLADRQAWFDKIWTALKQAA